MIIQFPDSLKQILINQYAQSDIVLSATDKIIQFHDASGLHWWSTIMLSTIAVQMVVTLPFAVYQRRVIARYELMQDELNTTSDKEIVQKIRKLADQNNWNQNKISFEYRREKKVRKTELMKKYNCRRLKLFILVFIQAPIWVIGSCVIRNLTYMQPIADATAQIVYVELKTDSFLWVHNLTVPDPYFPGFLILGHMINTRLNVIARKGKRTMLDKAIVILHTSVMILLCNFAMEVPSSFVLYWSASVLCALIQNLMFLSPTFRRLFRIPTTKSTRPNAFRKIGDKLKHMYKFLRY